MKLLLQHNSPTSNS